MKSDKERKGIYRRIDAGRGNRGRPEKVPVEALLAMQAYEDDTASEGDVVSALPPKTESAPVPAATPAAPGYRPPDGIRRRRRPGFFPYGYALALVIIAIFGVNIACGTCSDWPICFFACLSSE